MGGVPHTVLMEVAGDQFGIGTTLFEIAPYVAHEMRSVSGSFSAHGVGFDVLVHHLVRVEFGTIPGKKEETQLPGMLVQPRPHLLAAVHRMAVHDEEDLSVCVFHQASHEARENRRREPLLEHHEGQMPPIRQRRKHVAAKALARACKGGRLPLRGIRTARLMVRTNPRLIPPVNQGLFLPGRFADRRVVFFQPLPHRRLIPLVGAAHRLLGSKPPARQIAPNRPHRNAHPERALNQLAHRVRGPQHKREVQLFGMVVRNQLDDRGRLPARKPRPFPFGAPLVNHQGAGAIGAIGLDPPVNGLARDAKYFGSLHASHSFLDGGDRLEANLFLGSGSQGARISLHGSQYTPTPDEMQDKLWPD